MQSLNLSILKLCNLFTVFHPLYFKCEFHCLWTPRSIFMAVYFLKKAIHLRWFPSRFKKSQACLFTAAWFPEYIPINWWLNSFNVLSRWAGKPAGVCVYLLEQLNVANKGLHGKHINWNGDCRNNEYFNWRPSGALNTISKPTLAQIKGNWTTSVQPALQHPR